MATKPKQPKREATPEEEEQLLRAIEKLIDAALERGETNIVIELQSDIDGDTP
jgi:hypothetical protein